MTPIVEDAFGLVLFSQVDILILTDGMVPTEILVCDEIVNGFCLSFHRNDCYEW